MIALLAALALQDASELLKRDGWRAVDALAAKGDRAALEAAAKGDAAFLARAALAAVGETVVRSTAAKDAPAREVVEALFRAAAVPVNAEAVPDQKVSIEAGLPFFDALESLSRDLDVEFLPARDGTWRVAPGRLKAPRFAFRHARATLESAVLQTRTDYPGPTVSTFRLHGRFVVLGVAPSGRGQVNFRVVEAVDDVGTDLVAERQGAWRSTYDGSFQLLVPLGAPGAKATKLSRVRLEADVLTEKKREAFAFEKLSEPESKTLGGVTVTLRSVTVQGAEAKVELEAKGLETLDLDAILLADADGKAWRRGGYTAQGDVESRVVAVTFRDPGTAKEPAKLEWSLTTELARRTLFLEFTDVPIR